MKKTYYLITAMILLLGSSINAQSPKEGRNGRKAVFGKKILERKLAYFKENLMLTSKESVDFEKAYRKYESEKMASRKVFKNEIMDKVAKGKANDLSEREQTALIRKKIALDQEKCDINRNFQEDLLKILPPIKVIKYFKLERQFNRELMKRFKNRKSKARGRMSRRPMPGTPPPPPEE